MKSSSICGYVSFPLEIVIWLTYVAYVKKLLVLLVVLMRNTLCEIDFDGIRFFV